MFKNIVPNVSEEGGGAPPWIRYWTHSMSYSIVAVALNKHLSTRSAEYQERFKARSHDTFLISYHIASKVYGSAAAEFLVKVTEC